MDPKIWTIGKDIKPNQMGNLKMSKKRKSFSNEFKAKVAIEAIKVQKSIAEIASEFGIHSTHINNWKK